MHFGIKSIGVLFQVVMINHFNKKKIADLDVLEIPGDPDGKTILLLHGFGSNAMDLVPLHRIFQEKLKPNWLFPMAPFNVSGIPSNKGRAWFPVNLSTLQTAFEKKDLKTVENAFPKDLTEFRECIECLVGELNIPRSKLIIGGFSQGAVLSVDVALNGTESVAAILIFSGTLIYESMWRSLSHQHTKTLFFQSHGTHDPLLPLEKAAELASLLQDGGLKGKLHMFEGGHEIPQSILFQLNLFLKSLVN
ncbi:MAG: hypothetical protein R3E91_00520 [Chlamydiales bacterium]